MSTTRREALTRIGRGLAVAGGVALLSHTALSVREDSQGGADSGAGLGTDNYVDPRETIEPEVGDHNIFQSISRSLRGLGRLSPGARVARAQVMCAPAGPDAARNPERKPCYEGVIENTIQLGSFVYRPVSDNGQFNPEDCILDTVVKGHFKVELATGQNFNLETDESGWAKNEKGEQQLHVITESSKPGIKVVELPDQNGVRQTYYATDATITTFKKEAGGLVADEKYQGLLPLYKEGTDFDPDYCGRVWVIGLDINKIPERLLPGVRNNPQESPKTVHPLRKVS